MARPQALPHRIKQHSPIMVIAVEFWGQANLCPEILCAPSCLCALVAIIDDGFRIFKGMGIAKYRLKWYNLPV